MKTSSFCAHCSAKRFHEVICLSSRSERTRKKATLAVLSNIRKAVEGGQCPSFAGTEQSEIVFRITGNRDPYARKKMEVIELAKSIYPEFERWVANGRTQKERFRRAAMLAIAGNCLELSAPNYAVDLKKLKGRMWELVRKRPAANDIDGIFEKVKKAKTVLYLCDNCGEAVFDMPLISEIKKHAGVTIAVNSVPMDEDVSVREAKLIGLNSLARVIGKGRSYGVWKERAPKEFWKAFEDADFVIAKGMANFETLDEYKKLVRGRTACLLVVKCVTVGGALGLGKGDMAAKLL